MTPTNKRNLMLATSGLAGLAGLASLTLGVNDANAACVLAGNVVTCDGAVTSTNVNTEINNAPGPDLTVKVNAGSTVDTTPGNITIAPAKFTSAVAFSNGGTVGKADAKGYADPAVIKTLSITGDGKSAANTVIFTNDNAFYNNLLITDAGGAVTVNVNNNIVGTAATATTGSVSVVDARGDATFTSTNNAVVQGGVSIDANGPAKATITNPDASTKVTTTKATGGKATVTVGGSVGQSTDPGTFSKFTGDPSPLVFTGTAVVADGATGAEVKINAGVVGAITSTSTNSLKVDTVVTDKLVGANKLNSTTTVTSGGGGAATLELAAKTSNQNNVTVTADNGATVVNNGSMNTGTTKTTSITGNNTDTVTDITSSLVDAGTLKLVQDFKSKQTTTGTGSASYTANGTAGGTTIKGSGVTATLNAAIGSLTITGTASDKLSSTENNYLADGVTVSKSTKVTNSKNTSKDVLLTANTGGTAGAVIITNGGLNTVDLKTGGRFNSLAVNGQAAADTLSTVVTTNNGSGSTSKTTTASTTFNGGKANLALVGTVQLSALSGGTAGAITVSSNDDITLALSGAVYGVTSLNASPGLDTTTANFESDDSKGNTTKTIKETAALGGGAVSVTVGKTTKLGDLKVNATALTITADKTVDVVNDGSLAGGLTIDNRHDIGVSLTDTTETLTTTVSGFLTTTTKAIKGSIASETTGGAVNLANNSLNSIVGDVLVTSALDINFKNPGTITGNVDLSAFGGKTTSTGAESETKTTKFDPGDPDAVKAFTATGTGTITTTFTSNNAAITSDVSGIVGLDNGLIGATPGTLFSQTAAGNSKLTLSGTAFLSLSSTAGAYNSVEVETEDFTNSFTQSKANPGKVLLLDAAAGERSESTVTTTTSNGGKSDIIVTGLVAEQIGGGSSDVTALGHGGATVTYSGAFLDGSISATGTATDSKVSFSSKQVDVFLPASALSADAVRVKSFDQKSSTVSTASGGAALVDITGKTKIRGGLTADGDTTATVNLAAGALVGGDVNVTSGAFNGLTESSDTVTRGTTTYAITNVDSSSSTASTKSGAATATINGQVKGEVNVTANGGGAATGTINNTVDDDINIIAGGTNGSVTTTIVGTAPTSLSVGDPAVKDPFLALTTYPLPGLTGVDPVQSATTGVTSIKQTIITTEVGGAASLKLTAPAALAAKNGILVGGSGNFGDGNEVNVSGGTSATVDIGAGAVVDADIDVDAVLTTVSSTASVTNAVGVAPTQTGSTNKFTVANKGGTASLTNNGVVQGSDNTGGGTNGVYVNGQTATVTNNGSVGNGGGSFIVADALLTDLVQDQVTVDFGAITTLGATTTTTFTPNTGGSATVVNNNLVFGSLEAYGDTGLITNAAKASANNFFVGSDVGNYTTKRTDGAIGSSYTVTAGKAFVQDYTINQNGLLTGGGSIGGAVTVLSNPFTGDDIFIRGANTINATVNLNNGSVTTGQIGAQWNGADNFYGPVATAGEFLTNTNVNLVGNGFLGWDGEDELVPAFFSGSGGFVSSSNVFAAVPVLTEDQRDFADNAGILGNGATGSILGANAVTHTGPGTFYILGPSYETNKTANRLDDSFAIRAKTFTNTSGRLEFATDEDIGGFPGGADDIFGIAANTVNSGEFVLGRTVAINTSKNIGSLLNGQTIIEGQKFQNLGNFTQTDSGVLIVSSIPDLVRNSPLGVTSAQSTEVLGFFEYGIDAGPYTTVANSFLGDIGTYASHVLVEGNLDLKGKILVNNLRGGLFTDGSVQELFTVTGTVATSATVVSGFNSKFVTFELSTTKVGANQVVSVTTKRTSYDTVTVNSNAAAAARALDSAINSVVDQINKDANGAAVFGNVQQFREVQDLANVVAGFDYLLGGDQAAAGIEEIASGDIFGSLNALDHTAQFTETVNREGMGLMEGDAHLWATPTYRTVTIDGDTSTGAGEIKSSEAGLFFGGSFQPTSAIGWGFGLGYQGSEVDGEEKPYSAEVNTYLVGVSGSWTSGPIVIRGGLTYGASNIEARRSMAIFARDITADYDSHTIGLDLVGSYTFEDVIGGGSLTPYLRVNFRNISTDAFQESTSGGGLALNVAKFSETATTPELGVMWQRTEWGAGFATINPYLGASVLFNAYESASDQALAGGGDRFVINGVDPGASFVLKGGFSGAIGEMGSFSFGATGQFGDVAGGGVNAALRFNF